MSIPGPILIDVGLGQTCLKYSAGTCSTCLRIIHDFLSVNYINRLATFGPVERGIKSGSYGMRYG